MIAQTMKVKLSILISIFLLVSSIIIGTIGYLSLNSFGEELIGQKAEGIAQSVALSIDGDKFKELVETNHNLDSFYESTQKWMLNIKNKTGMTYLYTIVEANADYYKYIIDGSGAIGSDIFSAYGDLDAKENYPNLDSILKEGKSFFTSIYYGGEEWGNLVSAFAPIKDSVGNIVGIVGCDLNSDIINSYFSSFRKNIIVGTLITVIIVAIVFIILLGNFISKPIEEAVRYAGKIAGGDFREKVSDKYLKRKDEIGKLFSAFHNIHNNVRNIITQIMQSSTQLLSSAELLTANANQSAEVSDEIAKSIEETSNRATEHAVSIEEGSAKIAKLGDAIGENQEEQKNLILATEKVDHLINEGLQEIENLNQTMKDSSNAVNEISEKIIRTNESVNQIQKASKIIASIANKTNLLALNAAIEAARAGKSGHGFAVVAKQIRELAEQSSESIMEIDDVIKELNNNSSITVATMSKVLSIFHEQVTSVKIAEEKFNHISDSILEAIDIVSKLNESDRIMEDMKQEILEVMQNMSGIAEENAATTEQISAATEEQTAVAEEVSRASQSLSALAEELQQIIAKFKI